MGAWSKPQRTSSTPCAYGVHEIQGKFAVGLFRVGVAGPEIIRSIRLRLSEELLQGSIDRLNSRMGITRTQAAQILAECRR